jgi:hypothetical protein
MIKLFGGGNKEKRKKQDAKDAGDEARIGVEVSIGWIFSVGKERHARHTGTLLNKRGNMMMFGVYADRGREFDLKQSDVISASFLELKVLYNLNIQIADVRRLLPGEDFEIDRAANQLDSIYGYDKYIIEAVALDSPKKQEMREFFRMRLKIDVYYRIIEESEMESIASGNLKFDFSYAEDAKRDVEKGFGEGEGACQKLTTLDISAGGFRSRHEVPFEPGTLLDCIIIAGYEALPAIAKVLSARPDASGLPGTSEMFDVRAIFCHISEPVRDRVVKYILLQQKQMRSRFLGTKF